MKFILFFLFSTSVFATDVCDFIADDGKHWYKDNGVWYADATIESYGGVANSTGVNNDAAFEAAFRDNETGALTGLILQAGSYYNMNSTASFNPNGSCNNLTIKSSSTGVTAKIFSNNQTNLLSFNYADVNNWELRDIFFESTYADAASFNRNENEAAMVSMNFVEGVNHRFIRCEWNAPNYRNNAMKYYIDVRQQGGTNRTLVDGIYFEGNHFRQIGRFSIEILGIPSGFRTSPYTIADNDFPIRNIHIDNNQFDYNQRGYAISLVNGIEGVLIENNTITDTDCAFEISVKNLEIRYNDLSGTKGQNITFGGDYVGAVGTDISVNWAGHNYDIHDNSMKLKGGTDIMVGAYNVNFYNNEIESNGLFLTEGSISFERNDITFTGNRGIVQQDANAYGDVEFYRNNITLNNNINFASQRAGMNLIMECNNVYVINSNSFPMLVDSNIDNSKYVGGVFNTEYGDTGQNCGVVGYLEGETPVDPIDPVDPGLPVSLDVGKRRVHYYKYNNYN